MGNIYDIYSGKTSYHVSDIFFDSIVPLNLYLFDDI